MDLKGKKVFVTGAGGFIGSHLCEQLVKRGATVKAMVHYNGWGNLELLSKDVQSHIEVYAGEIMDPFSVKQGMTGADVVFHLASLIGIPYSYVAPHSYAMTNVVGTLNVMQAARELGTQRVVHTSTSETYGTAIYTPIDEKHPLQGQSPYSATKIGADKITESYYLSFGVPASTVRPFNTYGPRQSARAIIPTVISQLVSGKQSLKLGALSPFRDFTYVLDTVAGFMAVAESDKALGEVINIGSGTGVTIGELVNILMELTGKKVTVTCDEDRVRPEKSEVMKLLCNNAKAKELCGWQPRYTLKQGLQETITFIEKNLGLFRPDVYNV